MQGKVKCANEGCPNQVEMETDERFAHYPDYCSRKCEEDMQKLLTERYKNHVLKNLLRRKAGDMGFPYVTGAW